MKTVARGGVPQIPGMGPIPGAGGYGGGKRQAAKGKKKSGSRSGNPAKRAAENAARAQGVTPAGQGGAPSGSGFGLGGGGAAPTPSAEDLANFQKLLGGR
jgi:signal recognition particle subunit SRP54